jgi:hypothetical protein
VFADVQTTRDVRSDVLAGSKRGTATLDTFLAEVAIHETPGAVDDMASMEGVAVTDASVILLTEADEEILLLNDKGLIEVVQTHGVECWWVTTLLLRCVKQGELTVDGATEVLYDLVDEEMNPHPKVYAQVQKKLRQLGGLISILGRQKRGPGSRRLA